MARKQGSQSVLAWEQSYVLNKARAGGLMTTRFIPYPLIKSKDCLLIIIEVTRCFIHYLVQVYSLATYVWERIVYPNPRSISS